MDTAGERASHWVSLTPLHLELGSHDDYRPGGLVDSPGASGRTQNLQAQAQLSGTKQRRCMGANQHWPLEVSAMQRQRGRGPATCNASLQLAGQKPCLHRLAIPAAAQVGHKHASGRSTLHPLPSTSCRRHPRAVHGCDLHGRCSMLRLGRWCAPHANTDLAHLHGMAGAMCTPDTDRAGESR